MNTQTLTTGALHRLLATRDTMRQTIELPEYTVSALYEFFDALDSDDRAAYGDECTYEPGEIIFRESSLGDYAFLIWSGEVAVLKGPLDDPTILAYRGPGDLLGEMALLDDLPRSATVVALDRVQAICLPREAFTQLLRRVPEFGLDIMTALSQRLRVAHQQQLAQVAIAQQLSWQLEQAGREQLSLLPSGAPVMPGWDFAVNLTPLWQTSGDFYDFLTLENSKLGVLVADVADKGSRAAMYMALACTLLRTYAHAHPDDPAQVLAAANRRLLADTDSDQFVTVFYGVLDPITGAFTYANAGHNPALLVSPDRQAASRELGQGGPPLGVMESLTWAQHTVTLDPGARLVIYTDGVSEAANLAGEQFGVLRLLALAQSQPDATADHLRMTLLAALRTFIGNAQPIDDMTLLLVMRDGDMLP